MADPNSFNKAEIERKVDANPDMTETEKEAAKAKLFEMLSVVTKNSLGSQDRKDLLKKSWQLICVSSITLKNIENAIDMYTKLEDDGTRLRDIINDAYQQFSFLTPIDNILSFITALQKPHLKVSGVYALFSAMRKKEHLDNVKMLRIQEYVEEEIVPQLSETELKSNNLYQKLPSKVAKYVEDAITACVTAIQEEKYGEIIFYARECPENLEKHVPDIVKRAYNIEHFEKLSNFILALPTDTQKTTGINEILNQANGKIGKPELLMLEEKVKALENPSFDPMLAQIQALF